MSSQKNKKKKDAKKKSRIKKLHQKKISQAINTKYNSKYPQIEYKNEYEEYTDKIFVKKIKKIVKGIKFDNKKLFNKWQEKYFRLAKQKPIRSLEEHDQLVRELSKGDLSIEEADFQILHIYGEIIFRTLNKDGLCDKYIPFQGFNIMPMGTTIKFTFEPLYRKKSKYGTIYYSRFSPKIKINGTEKKVGLSKHAIERIIERSIYDNKTYIGYSELTKILINNISYKVVEVSGKKLLTFFECGVDLPAATSGYNNVISDIAKYILEKKYAKDESYYYRVGYMPIGLSDDFASCITLLLPGMKGTPEYELLKKSSCHKENKDEIATSLGNTPAIINQININNNLKALKWFHDNGIPQITTFEKEPYKFK